MRGTRGAQNETSGPQGCHRHHPCHSHQIRSMIVYILYVLNTERGLDPPNNDSAFNSGPQVQAGEKRIIFFPPIQ